MSSFVDNKILKCFERSFSLQINISTDTNIHTEHTLTHINTIRLSDMTYVNTAVGVIYENDGF